jgi:hypothetical protein
MSRAESCCTRLLLEFRSRKRFANYVLFGQVRRETWRAFFKKPLCSQQAQRKSLASTSSATSAPFISIAFSSQAGKCFPIETICVSISVTKPVHALSGCVVIWDAWSCGCLTNPLLLDCPSRPELRESPVHLGSIGWASRTGCIVTLCQVSWLSGHCIGMVLAVSGRDWPARGVKHHHGSSQRIADGARFAGTNRPSLGHTTSKIQFSGFSEMRPYLSSNVEFNMRSFTKPTLTAIAFGVALCLPSIPAF